MLACLGASACEVSTVIGVRELEEQPDVTGEPLDDLPSLDFPAGDCDPPPPISCDSSTEDPLQVVGLDCIDGTPAAGGVSGPSEGVAVQVGPLGPYEPREGEKFLILSTDMNAKSKASP